MIGRGGEREGKGERGERGKREIEKIIKRKNEGERL